MQDAEMREPGASDAIAADAAVWVSKDSSKAPLPAPAEASLRHSMNSFTTAKEEMQPRPTSPMASSPSSYTSPPAYRPPHLLAQDAQQAAIDYGKMSYRPLVTKSPEAASTRWSVGTANSQGLPYDAQQAQNNGTYPSPLLSQVDEKSAEAKAPEHVEGFILPSIADNTFINNNTAYPSLRASESYQSLKEKSHAMGVSPVSIQNSGITNEMMRPSALDSQPTLNAVLPPGDGRMTPVGSIKGSRSGRPPSLKRDILEETNPRPEFIPPINVHIEPPAAVRTNVSSSNLQRPPSQSQIRIEREPEVCVECMMRDRDMADVDVTGPNMWSRASDADFYEALAAEEADVLSELDSNAHTQPLKDAAVVPSGVRHPSRRSKSVSRSFDTFGNTLPHGTESEESAYAASSNQSLEARNTFRKGRQHGRVGQHQPLTSSNLALWTSMNISATSHRWKTLQQYLAEQALYLQAEKQARVPLEAEEDRRRVSNSMDLHKLSAPSDYQRYGAQAHLDQTSDSKRHSRGASSLNASSARKKRSQRTLDPSGDSPDDQYAHQRLSSTMSPFREGGYSSSTVSLSGQKPAQRKAVFPAGLAARRLSSPMPDLPSHRPRPAINQAFNYSTSDISRSFVPGRPPSVSRSVIGWSERDRDRRSTGLWSSISAATGGGGFRNASGSSPANSTFSLLTNGSMLDMHLGLDMDRKVRPLAYDPVRQTTAGSDGAAGREEETGQSASKSSKRKKKGIRKFLSRLFDSNSNRQGEQQNPTRQSEEHPMSMRQGLQSPALQYDDYMDAPLEPPFPSFFAGRNGGLNSHDRSSSFSSQSSSPHSPKELYRPTSVSIIDPNSPSTSCSRTSYFQRTDQAHHSHFNHSGNHDSYLQAKASRSTDLLQADDKRDKDLPPLPPNGSGSDSSKEEDAITPASPPLHTSDVTMAFRTAAYDARSFSPAFDEFYRNNALSEDIGGGKKAKAKSTGLFSLPFKQKQAVRPVRSRDSVLH